MITVHHLDNSRSQRILWLLEELGVPHDITHHYRDRRTLLAPPSLKAVHPLGKSPVIEDDGKVIAESGAIIEYILDRHDGAGGVTLRPDRGTDAWDDYVYWLHFAEGSAMFAFVLALYVSMLPNDKPVLWPRATSQIAEHLDLMAARLGEAEWFGGAAFGALDVVLGYVMEAGANMGFLTQPNLKAYLPRILARPAYQRAEARGGPIARGVYRIAD